MWNRLRTCGYSYALTIIFVSVLALAGCDRQKHSETVAVQEKPLVPSSPFVLTIATGRSGITLAKRTPHDAELPSRDFYVLLSNVSSQPQTVWEDWNSGGYISFELTTADGSKHVVSKRRQSFMNYPSTVVIQPGEHQVYVIHFDERWEMHPPIPKIEEMSVTLKAIYEVSPTPESAARYKVWTGRLESHDYKFVLRQW